MHLFNRENPEMADDNDVVVAATSFLYFVDDWAVSHILH